MTKKEETIRALLERQAERKRQRRIRTVSNIVSAAVILTSTACLIHLEAQDQAYIEVPVKATETVAEVVIAETRVDYSAPQVIDRHAPEPIERYVVEEEPVESTYTEADLEALALVIYQEAGGDMCSDETRMMVGNVVINRVADPRYPDTIEEVLLQKQQYGRLYWTGLVWPERHTNPGEAHAVARAYECAERILNGERVLPEDVVYQAEFEQGKETVAEQDGFYFCR